MIDIESFDCFVLAVCDPEAANAFNSVSVLIFFCPHTESPVSRSVAPSAPLYHRIRPSIGSQTDRQPDSERERQLDMVIDLFELMMEWGPLEICSDDPKCVPLVSYSQDMCYSQSVLRCSTDLPAIVSLPQLT